MDSNINGSDMNAVECTSHGPYTGAVPRGEQVICEDFSKVSCSFGTLCSFRKSDKLGHKGRKVPGVAPTLWFAFS